MTLPHTTYFGGFVMPDDLATPLPGPQAAPFVSHLLADQLVVFLRPLLRDLSFQLDVRLVRTFLATLVAIVEWRNRPHGLLLSELGAFLASPAHAPAGTKRLSRLLHSPAWDASLIAAFLWQRAVQLVTHAHDHDAVPLLVWDESVWEKPESLKRQGLGSVRSSKARRLTRPRPGFFSSPTNGRPICVAGLHWIGLLLLSPHQSPHLVALQWWSNRGEQAQDRRVVAGQLLQRARRQWKRQVRHIFDRGYATAQWLFQVLETDLRFVMRWKKGNKLLDRWGEERKAWQIARGQRSWGYRLLRDPHTQQKRKVGVVALSVTHPEHARPMWLVVARLGNGHEPWYLLTSDQVEDEATAWEIVLAYAKRWQIEMCWRYAKSELAIESIRVWSWKCREKLLLMVALVYGYLLCYTHTSARDVVTWLMRVYCHRTGKRSWASHAPLYRIRSALSRLWQAHPPSRILPSLNSG
jgi:hypothetical protein